MKRFVPLLGLAFAVGCQLPEPPAATTPPKPVTPAPTPAPTPTPVVPPDTKAAVPTINPDDNPKRIYQLRDLKTMVLKAPEKDLHLWIMDDDGKTEEGMMWLTEKDVRDDQGMIFAFPVAKSQSFWMENTLLPLDIIYVSSAGKVLNIAKGKPLDETNLDSAGPAQFVIELKQGFARKFGIQPGTMFDIPKSLKP